MEHSAEDPCDNEDDVEVYGIGAEHAAPDHLRLGSGLGLKSQ